MSSVWKNDLEPKKGKKRIFKEVLKENLPKEEQTQKNQSKTQNRKKFIIY